VKMMANHGQKVKYQHDVIGVNSRLDTLQAAILLVKIKYLDEYTRKRNEAAAFYDQQLSSVDFVSIPVRAKNSTHVFHQYTIKVNSGNRDKKIG
jgi:UDP-2-acetamido-2-deoxy-ribo-hexuluronate aminotransferase